MKKKFIIIFISFISIVCLFFYFTIFSKKEDKHVNKNNETSKIELPNISQINDLKNPILYDFVNSSISYKSNIDISKYGFYFAILQNKNDKENIFVEYYTYAEKLTYPSLGTPPKKIKLNQNDINSIENFKSKLSKNRVFKEGDWTLLIISQYNDNKEEQFNYCDKIGRWAGLDMNQFVNSEIGLMQKTIESGFGWPTKWLRKEPFVETMLKEGYNVKDEFWDKYNIKSYKIYKKNDEELKVEVVQLDRFKFKYNGNNINLNEKQLNEFLKKEGWEE